VHASPSKASSNTITVEPKPCGSCPDGYTNYLTSEGAVCVPVAKTDAGAGGACPQGYTDYLTSEGQVCLPTGSHPDAGAGAGGSSGGCPPGQVSYSTALERSTCVWVPTDGVCPGGTAVYDLTTESAICVPTPATGGCPEGYRLMQTASGPICI
jgi:hypothetical protein